MKVDIGSLKKKIIFAVIVLAFAAVGIACLIIRCLYITRENLLLAYEKQILPGIVCWGDSLTFGSGGNGTSYPSVLEERLRNERMYIPVVNMGIGGENTVTIAGRAGAIPFRLKEFTIPEESIPVEIFYQEDEGKSIRPFEQGDSGINPCIINGVSGRMSGERSEDGIMHYFFTRSEKGETVHVPEGTEVETWAASQYSDYVYVVFMGENHGWNNIQDLIEQQQAILSMQEKYAGNYIVVGLPTGTREERRELEEALYEAFGDKFLNIREYLSTQGIYDAGIKPSEDDLARMEEGLIPTSLLADHIHFNAAGYRLIGNFMYERMNELGYFDELSDVVAEYGTFF